MTNPKSSLKISPVILAILLFLVNFLLYWQVWNFDFIILDDHAYALNPMVQSGLSLDGLRWAFTGFDYNTGNWHPLTWLSLMLDRQLYGMYAGGYHLTNLLIHMANTMLLFVVLRRMTNTLWRSALVAFLFAAHPLHVESVVWVSERKDLLCAFFWFLATGSYFKYIDRQHRVWYVLTLLLFALALMAKPMAVTFPFVLILLDYWPLCRYQQRLNLIQNVVNDRTVRSLCQRSPSLYLFLEKGPFIALSLICSVFTFLIQQSSGFVKSLTYVPLSYRITNAFEAYFMYIVKMLWPQDLAVIYPLSAISFWPIVFAIGLIISLTAMVVRMRNKYPYIFTGWFWYVGTLVPVLGLVQVGEQSMADRYTYIPMTGLFIIITWGLADILNYKKSLRNVFYAFSFFLMCLLMTVSWFQIQKWRDSLTLFQHTLSVTTKNYVAHSCMGNALRLNGDLRGAERHFKEALRVGPISAVTNNTLGVLYMDLLNLDLAKAHISEAIRISPRYADAYSNLGMIYSMQKKYVEAIAVYDIALIVEPDYAVAYGNRGVVYLMLGKNNLGCRDAQKACALGSCKALEWSQGKGYCR